ncbi:MAG: class IV adenylate cyclase [Anaerolineales bacterium]|nr:class IV adenylate cyclase [Anaerolineales bacterium]
MNGLETEVKFEVGDVGEMRGRLAGAGAKLARPRMLEVNLRFDGPGNELRTTGRVLRLRQDDRARLTLKLPAGPWNDQAKTLHELEVEVGDFETTLQILVGLGYRVWFRYEKYRENYHLDETEISLDEMPFGNYIEIEGPLPAINRVAEQLGLAGARRITNGYYELFQQAKNLMGLLMDNCTFSEWQTGLESTKPA